MPPVTATKTKLRCQLLVGLGILTCAALLPLVVFSFSSASSSYFSAASYKLHYDEYDEFGPLRLPEAPSEEEEDNDDDDNDAAAALPLSFVGSAATGPQEENASKINDNNKKNENKGRGPGIRQGGEGRGKQLDKKKKDGKTDIYFVHIPKTGGSSMVKMLSDRCSKSHGDDSGEPNTMVYKKEKWVDDNGVQHRTFHLTAHAHIERYGRPQWDNAYTFAIVRHPLARQVSSFFYYFRGKDCKRFGRWKKRRIPALCLDEMSDEDKINAFHKWISRLHSLYPPDHPEHYLFGTNGHGNEVYKTFGSTQTSWLLDDHDDKHNSSSSSSSSIAVKDVFKLEELSGDVSKLSGNIPCLGSLEKMYRKNTTPTYPDYMLFAENKRTNKIINEVFADDFTNFNYEPL